MGLHEIAKALQAKSLKPEDKATAVADIEESFGGQAPRTRSDAIAEIQAKPESEPKESKSESKSQEKRKAAMKETK